MGDNGSGAYSRYYGSTGWQDDRNAGTKIVADRHDTHDQDIADALTNRICKDGQSTTSARIPFSLGVGLGDGTVSAPALNFTADANSGVYRIGADNIGVGVNGAKVLDIATTGMGVTGTLTSTGGISGTSGTFTSPVTISAGTAASPSLTFSGDTDTGVCSLAVDTVTVSTAGTSRFTVSSTAVTALQPILAPTGSAGAPAFSFQVDNDTGMYRNGPDTINFVTGGTSRIAMDTTFFYIQQSAVPSFDNTTPLGASGLAWSKVWTHDFDVAGAFSLSGGQIAFPATQNSSSNANTLDDYEEGTFTPDLKFGGTEISSAGGSYATRGGRYQKVGNRVNFQIYMTLGLKGSATGSATISGMPFASSSLAPLTPLSAYMSVVSSVGTMQPRLLASTSSIDLTHLTSGSTAAFLTDTNFTNSSGIYITGTYEASA